MKHGAASHGNLASQKLVVKDGLHRQAQQEVLLDLMELGPGHRCLMGQHVLEGQWIHIFSSERPTLSITCHGSITLSTVHCSWVCSGTGRLSFGRWRITSLISDSFSPSVCRT